MATVKVEGLDALKRKLAAMSKEIKAEVQVALEKSGAEMVATAKALAPVDEGELRASITMTTAGGSTPIFGGGGRTKVGDLAVTVTAGDYFVRYAAIVEFGRDSDPPMAARPFFWPAYRSLKKRIKSRNSRAVSKAVKKAIQ